MIPSLARSLAAVHEQRRALEAQINALLEAHPLSPVLTSMPGVGVRTAAVLLVTVGDGTGFPTAAHLASYAGLAPTTKSSGTSIHGEHAPRGGNRQLKRAMFLSAFACPARPRLPHLLRPLHAPAAKPTPKPSSASPATASASCSPCSATAPSTNPAPPVRWAAHRTPRGPGVAARPGRRRYPSACGRADLVAFEHRAQLTNAWAAADAEAAVERASDQLGQSLGECLLRRVDEPRAVVGQGQQ